MLPYNIYILIELAARALPKNSSVFNIYGPNLPILQVSPQELWTKSYSSLTMVTSSVLTFPTLGSGQFGQYKCVADYGGTSVESNPATITRTSE